MTSYKVIKLLKFKFAANLHCFQWEAQIESAFCCEISFNRVIDCASHSKQSIGP